MLLCDFVSYFSFSLSSFCSFSIFFFFVRCFWGIFSFFLHIVWSRYADCSTETISAEDIARVVQPAPGRANAWSTYTNRGMKLRAPAPAVVAAMTATREMQETSIGMLRAGKRPLKRHMTRGGGSSPAAKKPATAPTAAALAAMVRVDAATGAPGDGQPAATNSGAGAGVVHISDAGREGDAADVAAAETSPASPAKKRRKKIATLAKEEADGPGKARPPMLPGDHCDTAAEPPTPLAESLIRAVPAEIGRFRLDSDASSDADAEK